MRTKTLTAIIAALTIGAVSAAAVAPALAFGGKHGQRGPGPLINFEEIDANSDGKITPEELAEHRAARFAEKDTNGDGLLSPEEMAAAAIKRVTENAPKRFERMLDRADADGDGMISLAELPGEERSARMFDRLDSDGDGAISVEEMEKMKKRFGQGRKYQADE